MLRTIRSSAVLRRLTGSRMALFNEEKIIADVVKPMSIDIGGMRKPYKGKNEAFLEEDLVAKEPFGQFKEWFDEACNTPGIIEANAMCLATATKEGKPSARMVLLKGYGKEGFRFFTNYTSRKGQELTENPLASVVFYWSYNGEDRSWSRQIENPQACLCFYWEPLMRSVRVEGRVERIGEEKSTEYFHSRPRSSQIGACVSPQSQVIADRHILLSKDKQLQEEYKDVKSVIPKPECWGGFLIVPDSIEFWQGQTNRIHDRIRFRKLGEDEILDETLTKKGEDGWVYERLAP
uniref:pyridoxal 5'-phosphate synthase n=1 Tax=Scylla olivacea TaxID=85551 RepID=A0A0P4W5N0_SCYOL